MDAPSGLSTYYDLDLKASDHTSYYFLEQVIRSRIALHLDTGTYPNDEEANVYVAGLLQSLLTSGSFLAAKPYVSGSDRDVRGYLEEHPGNSTEFVVYKENADYALVSVGVFSQRHHAGSYHGRVLGETDEKPRMALYYRMAGSALSRITRGHASLEGALNCLADHIDGFVAVVQKVAAEQFDMGDKLSEGSLFHLQREMDTRGRKAEYEKVLDEFLALFAENRKAPSAETTARLHERARLLRALNPGFRFEEPA